ncbi:MAG: hypothetical protein HY005_00780 [Candidatus Staskawiczbacteria bacterium]|nr:hypothetical protein [Candidatus Staskawiczbacteria bacterium]
MALILAFVDKYMNSVIILVATFICAFIGIVLILISTLIIDKNDPEWKKDLDERWEQYFKNRK